MTLEKRMVALLLLALLLTACVPPPPALPDLTVDIVAIDDTTIVWGAQPWTWITYRVTNAGLASAPSGQIYLRDWTNGAPTSGYMVVDGPIAPGASVDGRFAVGHDSVWPPDAYTVRMEVDYRSLVNESNEDNNFSGDIAFTVVPLCANPALNTVVSAHGNTDWHVDTAEEFLFGTDMIGNPTAANHCPDTWASRRHMHVGLANTADYYHDSSLSPTGADTDATRGIDTAMLFFYAGHGSPTYWNTLGNNANQSLMRLGDCAGSGQLRYYWQCSCQVFAHGPSSCPGSTHSYACPADFDGSADSPAMRNVYERWGPALDEDLRMACGASTSAYCHEQQMNRIWDSYNNLSYDVADSFIRGLRGSSWVVPLCITVGGSNVAGTPLYDTAFTNQINTSGSSHYHIQYIQDFASTPRVAEELSTEIPAALPILEVGPMELPAPLADTQFESEGDLRLSSDEVAERGPRVRVNQASGAVYIVGEPLSALDEGVLGEEDYLVKAQEIIEELGWTEANATEPTGMRMVIETASVDASAGDGKQTQKNVIVTQRRQVVLGDVPIAVLGEGGNIEVQMNNDGSVLNASKVWRQIASAEEGAETVRVKTFQEAYDEALGQIENADAYELDNWEWGYLEEAGNVAQTEMRIVFRFWFVPTNAEAMVAYPPQMIEIPGQVN